MATLSASQAKHVTLTGGAEDTVTLTSCPPFVEVVNRDATLANTIGVRVGSVAQKPSAVASATGDDVYVIVGGGNQKIRLPVPDGSGAFVRIFGAAASPYSVHGLWGQAVIPG